jgi:hypothetical protein
MEEQGKRVNTHRVITLLDRQEMDFLDKLGKDALFSTGRKLSYNDILRSLIDFAKDIDLSGDKINSVQELRDRILQKACAKMWEKKD